MKPVDLIQRLQVALTNNPTIAEEDVVLEGCDCANVVADVEVRSDGINGQRYVALRITGGVYSWGGR